MITLTPEQRQLLQQSTEPSLFLDPDTKREYILIGVETYQRLQELLGDMDSRDAYPLLHRALREEGWDDPHMDEYNRYG